ncbi:MAG: cellulose-binding family, partial [Phycisphaerales bacterium]|nr:cellulose-binding family [Phycisphaerales bacterium]
MTIRHTPRHHRRPFAESLEARQHFAAQAYDWNSVTIKGNGFINGVVYNPAAANTFYAHADIGGAYRWDATAGKWASMIDWAKYNDGSANQMGVETLAVDPTDANRVYMSVGTYMSTAAIMRSTDGGKTFLRTNVSGINANGNGNARNTGERMMVDPNSPNILYYGTRDDGLWKSTDYAATWTRVTAFPTIGLDSGFSADAGILFVRPDASSGSAGSATPVWYAGVLNPTAGVTRIYRSTDAGVSWAALPGGQPTTANLFPQRMALSPDGTAMYVTYSSSTTYGGPYGLANGRVYKVTNPKSASPVWTNVSPQTAYGFSAIALDPTNPNTVYAGEINDYNPADRIWRSTNGGSTWTVLSPNSNRDDSSAAYASSQSIHWLGDLEIDPTNANIAMLTTGYGIYRTTNLTAANPRWAFFNDGLEESAALELASPNDGAVNLISAIGDRDGYRHIDFATSPSGSQLGRTNGVTMGTNTDIDVAFNDSTFAVRTGNAGRFAQYSLDNGINWAYFGTAPANATGGGSIAISADGTRAVWDPAGAAPVSFAVRSGSTWSAWQPSAANAGTMDGTVVTADLVNPMTLYAYGGSTVWRSTDGGTTFARQTTSAGGGSPTSVRATPGAKGQLYASTYGNGLWQSADGGATWSRVNAAAVTTGYQVGVGAPSPTGTVASLYVAGTVSGVVGVFRSDDRGATWTQVNDDAHQYGNLSVIQADPRVYGRIYLGTNGRGIIYGDIAGGPPAVPAPPSFAATSNIRSNAVALNWTDNAASETGFTIERSTDGVSWTQVASALGNATSYDVTGLAALTRYWFRVRAGNATGGSAYTNIASAQTTATPPAVQVVTVNGGQAQRSMVTDVGLQFSAPVNLNTSSLSLIRRSDGQAIGLSVSNPSGDRMTYALAFAPQFTVAGSLPDGIYDLSLAAAGAVSDTGQPLETGFQF